MFFPSELGADIVIHSLTKFINGASDTLGGVICSNKEFIGQLIDVNDGAAMLLGPSMDGLRANGILKNVRTLAVRMKQHSQNASYLAQKFQRFRSEGILPGFRKSSTASIDERKYEQRIWIWGYASVRCKFHGKCLQTNGRYAKK